jgi:hypothetical protein
LSDFSFLYAMYHCLECDPSTCLFVIFVRTLHGGTQL